MNPEGDETITALLSHTAPIRSVERARIVQAAKGRSAPIIAAALGSSRPTLYAWMRRFNDHGLAGLEEQRRSGRPPTYSPEQRAEVIATALADSGSLGLLDEGPPPGLSRRAEGPGEETQSHRRGPDRSGPSLARTGDVVRRAGRPRLRRNNGIIGERYTAPPEGSVVVCLDEMGPESARSFRGSQPVHADPGTDDQGQPKPGERPAQEADYGRRGKGSIFGAFRPASGEALTAPDGGRTAANRVDLRGRTDGGCPRSSSACRRWSTT